MGSWDGVVGWGCGKGLWDGVAGQWCRVRRLCKHTDMRTYIPLTHKQAQEEAEKKGHHHHDHDHKHDHDHDHEHGKEGCEVGASTVDGTRGAVG